MEDRGIIELFYARMEQGIVELSNKYGRLCYTIAYNILISRSDAEECENDTYLRVWNTIPPVWPDCLRAYVSRIVRNLALDRVRYLQRKKRSAEMDYFLSEMSECIPSSANVEQSADHTVVDSIAAFLDTLDAQTRVLFVRRYFYMESVESLAVRYGLNASSISTKLTRTRARLRSWLEEEGVIL